MAISLIDGEKCIGCGTCAESCPMDVIRRESSPTGASALSPCRLACPARIDIKGYIRLLAEGKMKEAVRLLREESPLPAVTGHVCFHPCEEGCSRNEVDRPVNINGLERYIADYWLNEKAEACALIHDKRVAVIGSGPAGLAAAYVLVRKGYPVTVFDGNDKPGGMLRTGIPEYRLPQSILDAQIDYIRHLGVEFENGVVFGKDVTLEALKAAGFGAVLLAVGAQLSRTITMAGADASGVLWGLDFLRAVKLGREVKVGPRTVVVGGGNVAVDAALTALRLGSEKVRIVCLEMKEQMPAHLEVVEMAVEEGVEVSPGWGPKGVTKRAGRASGIEVVRCLSVFDEKGGFSPCLDDETRMVFEADSVIFAIGETMDASSLPPGLETRSGHILVDPRTMETNLPGVFAAGVAAGGVGSVVEAIASGKKAAFSMDRFLRGENLRMGTEDELVSVEKLPKETIEKRSRQQVTVLPAEERKSSFGEIKGALEREAAEEEVRRCMACGNKAFIRYPEDCMTCYTCEKDCPREAIRVSPGHISSPVSCWG